MFFAEPFNRNKLSRDKCSAHYVSNDHCHVEREKREKERGRKKGRGKNEVGKKRKAGPFISGK